MALSLNPKRLCVYTELTMVQRIRDMLAAMIRAEQTNDPNDYEHKRFRTFNFIFANTFLHEIGHVFVNFLTKGRTGTPRRLRAEVAGYSAEDRGEAGRHLETIIFGGTLEYFRDHADDESQVESYYCFFAESYSNFPSTSANGLHSLAYLIFSPGKAPVEFRGNQLMPPLVAVSYLTHQLCGA